jgi:iron-sulfur cluster repair protein YtfE (RIC family)
MTAHTSPSKLDSVTRYLAWDHDRLDGLLGEVTQRVERGDLGPAHSVFSAFDQGLRRHIRMEEELLFPLFESRTGMKRGPTVALRAEHRAIEVELSHMRDALELGDASAYATGLSNLHVILGPHNVKEEQVLYPITDDLLQPEEQRDLVDRLTHL